MSKFFAVRTLQKKEEKLLDTYFSVIKSKEYPGIYAALAHPRLKGFIIVEAEDANYVVDSIRKIPNAKNIIYQAIPFDQVEKYLEEDKEEEQIKIAERNIVEIITDPFRGYKARVVRVLPVKNEVVVELLDIPNPIPVTLHAEDVRVLALEENEE